MVGQRLRFTAFCPHRAFVGFPILAVVLRLHGCSRSLPQLLVAVPHGAFFCLPAPGFQGRHRRPPVPREYTVGICPAALTVGRLSFVIPLTVSQVLTPERIS